MTPDGLSPLGVNRINRRGGTIFGVANGMEKHPLFPPGPYNVKYPAQYIIQYNTIHIST